MAAGLHAEGCGPGDLGGLREAQQNQVAALMPFGYNEGAGVFGAGELMGAALRSGDMAKVSATFLDYEKPSVLAGRRVKERAVFDTPEPKPKPAPKPTPKPSGVVHFEGTYNIDTDTYSVTKTAGTAKYAGPESDEGSDAQGSDRRDGERAESQHLQGELMSPSSRRSGSSSPSRCNSSTSRGTGSRAAASRRPMSLHLPYLWSLLGGVLGMVVSDCCGTYLVVAESRGHSKLAGAMDAVGDLASIAVTVTGVGNLLSDGITWRSVSIVAAIVVTSYIGTAYWTGRANQDVKAAALEAR